MPSSISRATTGCSHPRTSCPSRVFGNLIALPLQGECRRKGATVFLDPSTLEPFPDQWEFLVGCSPQPGGGSLARRQPWRRGRWPRLANLSSSSPAGRRALAAPVDQSLCLSNARDRSHRASTTSARCAEARRFAAQPRLLREGAEPVLNREDPEVHPRIWRDDRPASAPPGVRPQAEAIALEAGSRLDVTEAHPTTDVVGL